MHYEYYERLFNYLVQGSIFNVAVVFVLMSLSKSKRTGNATHLKWLIPLAIYTVEEAITYAIDTGYALLNDWEPEPLNTITDMADSVAMVAFLWALIVLWSIVRHTPEVLKLPWVNAQETQEGVWPPAPKIKQ